MTSPILLTMTLCLLHSIPSNIAIILQLGRELIKQSQQVKNFVHRPQLQLPQYLANPTPRRLR